MTDSTDQAEELETEDRRVSPDGQADESGQAAEIASEEAAIEETAEAQGVAVKEGARETVDGSEKNGDGEPKLVTDESPPAGSDPGSGAVEGSSREDDGKEAPPAAEQPKADVADGNGESPEVREKIADDSSPDDKETGDKDQKTVEAEIPDQAAETDKDTVKVAGETQGRGEEKTERPTDTKTTTKVEVKNGQDAQLHIFDEVKQVNNYNYYGYKGEEAETESASDPVDPTNSLPPRTSRIPALGLSKERGGILEKLKQDRAILLSSRHHEIALGAAYSIIDDTGLISYQKRALTFDGSNRQREIQIDYFIDEKCVHSGTVVLVDIQSQIFFDSLQCSPLHAGMVRQLLAGREMFLICAVEPTLMEGVPSGTLKERIPFEIFTVPFLRHLLEAYFDLKEARELEAKIQSQHEGGLWGEPGNDADLYERIQGYSKNGAGGIREAVEQREGIENRAPEPGSLEEIRSLEEIQPVKATDLFRVDDPVLCVVLYVATYFKQLSPQELSSIVTLLLGEAATAESVEKVASKKKKRKKQAQDPEPRLLREIWNEDCDDVLHRCSLHLVSSSSGDQIIDFDFPHLRKELRRHLEARHPMFLQRQFRKLQESGLLFESATPLTVQRNLICLSVERTIADPQYYDANWMIRFVLSVREHLGVEVSSSDDPAEQFQRLLEALEKGQQRDFFYTRLSDLIREMLKHPRLQRTVHDFLATLVAHHLTHNEVLDLVLRIAYRLRSAPHFDPFFWLKRLIDEGGAEIKPQIYNGLHRLVHHNGLRIYEVLGALEDWLPKENRLAENYSPSNRYALSFIVDYCRQTATAVPAEKYGQWPSRYPLFAALTDNDKTADERLNLLARWLFHPGLVVIFDQSTDLESARSHVIVGILELWILILEGLEPGGSDPKANRVADALLDAVSRHLDKPLRRRIYRSLQTQQKKYGQFASWTPPKNRALRRELRLRRSKVMTLRQRLVHFEESSPSTRAEGLP